MNEPTKKIISRKFITTLLLAGILVWVFIRMEDAIHDPINFGLWLAGLLATFGIYTTGNLVAKKPSGGTP